MGTSKILIDGVGIDLAADTVAEDKMLSGTKAHDANGDVVTGSIPSKAAATYTPGTSNQTIGAGQYLSGAQTIQGDADLMAGNIKSGVDIFGVTGNLQPAKPEQSKTLTLGAAAPATVTPDGGKVLSSVPVVLDTSVIKAENIKKDVTMLGVTGTHEGGGGWGSSFLSLTVNNGPMPKFAGVAHNGTPINDFNVIGHRKYTLPLNSIVSVSLSTDAGQSVLSKSGVTLINDVEIGSAHVIVYRITSSVSSLKITGD